VNKEIVN